VYPPSARQFFLYFGTKRARLRHAEQSTACLSRRRWEERTAAPLSAADAEPEIRRARRRGGSRSSSHRSRRHG
jgi:hypothetical protein